MAESPAPLLDRDSIAEALRALGMLYGTRADFAEITAGARSEEEAIRMYIERERAHLLGSYDLETLVRLVREARAGAARGVSGVERYAPE